jgi:hypothetical protein
VALQAPEKALHRVSGVTDQIVSHPDRTPFSEEPDGAGLALSFGHLAGDSGTGVLFSRASNLNAVWG